MTSFAHKKIIKQILDLDTPPSDRGAFKTWIEAETHLQFLRDNAASSELVIYACGPYSFVHSVIVSNETLFPLNKSDLLQANGGPSSSAVGYATGGGRNDMWIDRTCSISGSNVLEHSKALVFNRNFEGWTGADQNYSEISQEYTHLSDIHWRPEYSAYCYFDRNGELACSISISKKKDSQVSLVTFERSKLEQYLAISNSSLVRLFDFTLLRRAEFSGWSKGNELLNDNADDLFYRQKVDSNAAYTTGVQIVRPNLTAKQASLQIENCWSGKNTEFVEFIAHDLRNNAVIKISTDPNATTNYFEAENNSLPYELSPAFFRPDVLSKYKTDREKYTIKDRDIYCRSSWHLRGYDVNEAGQVHAYIYDLRKLPYSEQLYWLSFNEKPKADLSRRAIINDLEGGFVAFQHPRQKITTVLDQWEDVSWWKLKEPDLLNRANPPISSSKDEWSNAFKDLSQFIMEGFNVQNIREALTRNSVQFGKDEASIRLLERLYDHIMKPVKTENFTGLKEAQKIRSKLGCEPN